MSVSIIQAEYIEDYKIKLYFDNGESGVVDLKETIFNDNRKIFEPLRDKSFFKSFELDSWTVIWSNDADFAPEFLYDLMLRNKNDYLKTTIGQSNS